MPPINNTYGFYALVMFGKLGGGGADNIEPSVATLKNDINPNVLAYEPSPGKMTELLKARQAMLAVWGSRRVVSLAATGFPVRW